MKLVYSQYKKHFFKHIFLTQSVFLKKKKGKKRKTGTYPRFTPFTAVLYFIFQGKGGKVGMVRANVAMLMKFSGCSGQAPFFFTFM
jgi:hypothetical protein